MGEVSALPTRLNHLSLAKRALIEKRLRGQLSHATESSAIHKRTAHETAPLSFAQHRLWFVDQLESGSASYNLPAAVRLIGELQIDALRRSFSEIIRRHEILRAVFTNIDGNPVQTIKPATSLTLPVIDLCQLDEKEREAELRRLTSEEAQRPFDLETGPLLRVSLVKLGEKEHVALLTMHHIVSDAWSMGVLVKEVAALYEAYREGRPSPLAELPIQYADYAGWQREWLTGDVLEEQLSYWREQLGGELPVLELPTDHVRPNIQSYRGGQLSFEVSDEVLRGLKALSRQQGATLFMTLLSAFQLLLMRYSGQEDVIVGTDIANRTRTELESLIGFFINQLVMRTNLTGDPTFEELVERVREVCLSAYAHQDIPFEKLVEELAPERTLSHTPLFQVKFLLQNTPMESLEVPGLRLEALHSASGAARFDLTLAMTEYEGRLLGSAQYNADLFERETIERMGAHFQTLLAGIVSNPQQRLSQLPMLTAAERHQLLVEWNDTQQSYPREQCIHQLFEEQVERTPDSVAVLSEGEEVSYGELNRRANQLAHHLRSLGVGPEVLVGLCLERSVEMVVAVLGVLKAGGAYLPLDPEYPLERLAWMLEDSNVPLLLTQQWLVDQLPTHWGQTINLDAEWERITKQSAENPVRIVAAENLAYVIYTSGSTGTPKGVMVGHRGLSNLVTAQADFFGLGPGSRMLQFASFSFDAATFEIFTALCNGAALCLASAEALLPGPGLVGLLREQGVTNATLPPSALSVLEPEELPQLKAVISVAEACTAATVERWASGGRRFLNGYGPTEASIGATVTECQAREPVVTIGRPLANVQVYILDGRQQVVPVGVAGEIYIGGEGLARGYLNRPEWTAERFIAHPYSKEEGARLYRTGDRGRYLGDGRIEFLGRVDQQVKVRGYRIELGEIEAALGQHPSVKDAVVIAREGETNQKRLVAYCVRNGSQPDNISVGENWNNDLRQFLKKSLPEYMIPSAFVMLDELPLTPNGKVDRAALPAFEQMAEKSVSHVGPRTPIEELLAGIWLEILKVPQVSIHDNFFELGGHSLLATQLVSRIREVFKLEAPLRLLFEQPTVALLGESVESLLHDSQSVSTAPPIESVRQDQPLPLSFAQQRIWFIDQLESGSAFYNMPTALHLTGELNINALEHALSEIIRRHEILRTHFVVAAGEPVQVIAEAAAVSVPVTELSQLGEQVREAEVERLAQEEAQRAFDLSRGPLLRVQVLRLGEQEHVALLTMHHIVSDAWSMGVLVREIATLYSAYSEGRTSPLAELPIQYADYAAWQRRWLSGEVLESQLSYWREQLGGELPVLELPTDHVRPNVQSYRGGQVSFSVSEEVLSGLIQLSRRQGATLFMTLLSAFQLLLMRYSGQEDVIVGTDIAGRTRTETETLIGFFINQLVMRTDLTGDPTFEELIERVREVCLGAYAHQDVPFEQIVDEFQPERSLSHTPLFQVKFLLQNTPMESLEVPGLAIRALHTNRDTAEFDLTVGVVKTADRLYATFEYNADLFERETIERMGAHFQTLLAGIVSNPQQRLSQLPMLTAAERHQLLVEWNDTQQSYPREQCIHELFEEQVERTPDSVAVLSEGEEVSYGELNRRANQLAHHLRSLGVGPEVLVGLCLERSVEMVVAVLGVLKAGGAYLPLDPEYPLERLAWMLEDSNVPLLLAQEQVEERLPTHWGQTINLDAEWERITKQSAENPVRIVAAENLAYVIYTSGSTGTPKGVMVGHRGLSNLVTAQADFFGLGPGSRMLQFASFSFDAATFEIFTALCNGAALCLASAEALLPGPGLVGLLREQGVTNATLPPSALSVLEPEELPQLKAVISVAEACTAATVERWASGGRRFLNGYGPTEASIGATVTECQAREPVVTIGRPLANVQVYILDGRQQVVPVGVAGEIYIGGEGLARGYLNRPELTAERFIAHPYSLEEGARLYRTGDRGRYLGDGRIEFLGRVDQQVKVRGYRIELGEIEAALGQYREVSEAVVVARQDAPGETRLVAYLVVNQEGAARTNEVRSFLRTRLPEYMIPSAFVLLDELPLTPNGKVDRAALPAPETGKMEDTKIYVAPRNELEQMIMEIWREVLNVEAIGINDNFFDLGGHSLLIAKAHACLQDALKIEFSMVGMFEHPTISSLAEFFAGMTKDQSTMTEINTRGETRKNLLQKQKLLRENRRAMVKTMGAENE